jgi:DNA-binding NarL/FixJ family response regulator
MERTSIESFHAGAASRGRPIRVAVLGTHALSREGLGALIAREPDMQPLSAGDFDALVNGRESAPNVVVLDADADADGAVLQLLDEARRTWPEARVLAVTTRCDVARLDQLMLAGARGVVTKDKSSATLAEAIRKVNDGELWLGRTSTSRLIARLAADRASPRIDPEREKIDSLTAREREIVGCVSAGFGNKAIATHLGISENTVRHHLTSIFAKLSVPDRLGLAVYAMRHGVRFDDPRIGVERP